MRDRVDASVILTRATADNAPLATVLRELGAIVIDLPCIDVQPVADGSELERCLQALTSDDLLVVTSRAGARAVATALGGEPLRAPLAVVGRATEHVARELGLEADFRPSRQDAEALADELPLPRGAVVLARSDHARPGLVERLRARGATVRDVVAYRTTVGSAAPNASSARTACERGAVAVLASPSAVDGFAFAVGIQAARRCTAIAIGPTTAAHVRQVLGQEPFVAATPDQDGVVAAIRGVPSARVVA